MSSFANDIFESTNIINIANKISSSSPVRVLHLEANTDEQALMPFSLENRAQHIEHY